METTTEPLYLEFLQDIRKFLLDFIQMQNSISTSDWVLIATTSVLAIIALFGPYTHELWKSKFYSPDLAFEFKHRPPYCHQTEMRGSISFLVYYFRFTIANNGRRQADQCEVILEKIWQENEKGKLEQWENFSPVPLKWSGSGQIRNIPLQPERKVFCDIGSIQPQKYQPRSVYKDANECDASINKFFFEIIEAPFSQPDYLVPGKYKIELAVYSANSNKKTRIFKIDWSGKWKDDELEMLKELVIEGV
ncbi:MAG: hypothetical protein NPINA01_11700 [Nitrospinaceae bacterium]|nr:MAG: hypothetical protein NPINA01_11700 [Nitrospinaceae bacterium]